MASEAATVLLALIGIGIIVVGIMILMRRSPSTVEERVVARPTDYQWRGHYYSHLPVRPIMIG